MSLSKVYLAKSNKANPNLVMAVREKISEYDLEIVEYEGGHYSDKPLLKCDFLIIVPDLTTFEEGAVMVGKGLYQQVDSFSRKNDISQIFVVCDFDLTLSSIEEYDIQDDDDYINYGFLGLGDYDEDTEFLSLPQHFDKMFDKKMIKSKQNKNYYLLIKK